MKQHKPLTPHSTLKNLQNSIRILSRYSGRQRSGLRLGGHYGDKDYLLDMQDWFEDEFGKMNIPHTFHKREGYGHEWALWDRELESFLLWLSRTDAYAKSPGRCV